MRQLITSLKCPKWAIGETKNESAGDFDVDGRLNEQKVISNSKRNGDSYEQQQWRRSNRNKPESVGVQLSFRWPTKYTHICSNKMPKVGMTTTITQAGQIKSKEEEKNFNVLAIQVS